MAASLCKTIILNQPIRKVEVGYFGPDRIHPSELEQVRQDSIVEGKRQAEEIHNAQILEFREELRTLHDDVLGAIQEEFAQLKMSVTEAMPRMALNLLKKTLPLSNWMQRRSEKILPIWLLNMVEQMKKDSSLRFQKMILNWCARLRVLRKTLTLSRRVNCVSFLWIL